MIKYANAISNCDPEGPLMLCVSRIIPSDDKSSFYANFLSRNSNWENTTERSREASTRYAKRRFSLQRATFEKYMRCSRGEVAVVLRRQLLLCMQRVLPAAFGLLHSLQAATQGQVKIRSELHHWGFPLNGR